MFRASNELAAVFKRLMAASASRDVATARSLIAPLDEVLVVGSDAREWLHGVEAREVMLAQAAERPDYRRTYHRLEAFEDGSSGWVAADVTVAFANGMVAHDRVTAVFHLIDGVWQMVQWHQSVPRPNVETMGLEVSTSLSQLIDSVDADVQSELEARFRSTTVTILFSDVEGSTQRTARLGDAVWGDVIRRHLGELQSIAVAHDGIVVKTMGDGAMLAFASARDGAQSAVEIQRSAARQDEPEPLAVRVGVHTGDAIHDDGDYLGHTVNKTARIAAAAEGGQVLVSDVVRGLADQTPGLVFSDPIPLELKGIPGTNIVYALRGE